jgi:hypothetical protein
MSSPGAEPGGTQAPHPTTDESKAAGRPPVLLQVRPKRITIYASIAAAIVVGSMVIVGLLLRDTNEGVEFRTSDQIGLIGVGLILGGVIMTAARPRLRVDRTGLWIRNVFGESFTPWQLVTRVAYPQGAPWAQLMMPDDEVKPVMAIQAMDRGRAVQALEEVRALQATYAPPPPRPPAPRTPEQDPPRPLGRLEIIDREKAAARDRDRAAKAAKQARKAGGRPPAP